MDVVTPVFLLVLGLLALLLAVGNLNYERHRRSRGVVTEGVIVACEWTSNTAGARFWAPIVEFVDRDGAVRRFKQRSGTSFKPAIGRRVAVWYDPEGPDGEPVLHEDTVTKALPVVAGSVGVLATALAVLLLVRLVSA